MISLKKSYARQLLQLAITLSLLRVDPENYLGWGWESQLALQNGDGWQLELRAAPLTDYPYSNRKALIPLIEDLVRFDRQMNNTSSYDVQTYLLNVQNEQVTALSSNIPPPPSLPPASISQPDINSTTTTPTVNAGSIIHQIPQNLTRNTTEFTVPIGSELADLFLNAEAFAESASVLDQNLADLNDYENYGGIGGAQDDPFLNFNSLYAGLPLKDEPNDTLGERLLNIRFGESEHEPSTSSNDSGSHPSSNAFYGLLRAPDSPRVNYSQVIEWSEYFRNDSIKTEEEDNVEVDAGALDVTVKIEPTDKGEEQSKSSSQRSNSRRHDSGMKLESDLEDDIDDGSSHGDSKNSTSGFSSNVELTEEVSDCIFIT